MQKSGRGDSRVKTSALPENALGSVVNGHPSHSHSSGLLNEVDLGGSCWKMSRGFSHPTMVQISDVSLGRLPNSGMAWRGAPLTLAISVLHNDEGASSSSATVTTLSQVLERNAPQRFSLSAKAAAGILRRADRRGKRLPESLRIALEQLEQSSRVLPTEREQPKTNSSSDTVTERLTLEILAATSPQPSPQNGQREAVDLLATKPKTLPLRTPSPHQTDITDTVRPEATDRTTSLLVRRLTPVETERLMGWPDGWTIVESWGKPTMGLFGRKRK